MKGDIKINKFCGQKFDELDMMEYHCGFADCKHCGHNPRVAEYRKKQIERNGLKKGPDGLWYYTVIRRGRKSGKIQG